MATITNRNDFKAFCTDNKYCKWYFNIIDNALARGWTKKTSKVYVESHHIIPKSILKNNDTVILTAREHFICHLLLPKFLEGQYKYKMLTAAIGMKRKSKRTEFRYINSRLYNQIKSEYGKYRKELWKNEEYRIKVSKSIKDNRPDQNGKNNPMYGRTGKLSPHYGKEKTLEHKNKIKQALTGMKYSKDRCENMSKNCPKNSLGKKWYHDSINKIEKYFIQGQQPENFMLGRL